MPAEDRDGHQCLVQKASADFADVFMLNSLRYHGSLKVRSKSLDGGQTPRRQPQKVYDCKHDSDLLFTLPQAPLCR
jgi:hypothetical protein